jgi:hypothetical protein
MNKKHINSEKGQAIVYLVLGIVVFLGFVALAIDGSMVLANRRNEQNAADAASLAGGGKAALDMGRNIDSVNTNKWNCGNLTWLKNNAEYAAQQRAGANGFSITYEIDSDLIGSDYNYAFAKCYNLGLREKYLDVTVEISATTPSNFLQLLFPSALQNEVEAVTRVYPPHQLAFGNAIVSLNPSDCSGNQNGAIFKGNGDTYITGGGVFSNGCLEGGGRPSVTIDGAGFNYGLHFIPGNAAWDPQPPTEATSELIQEEDYDLGTEINCNGHWVTNNDIDRNGHEIGPGLYCFHGDFTTQSHDVIVGHDVTFYVEGDITFNGNDTSILVARDGDQSPTNDEIPGVLIYVPHMTGSSCPDQTVIINGTSDLTFTGIVLAPCADVTMNGTTGIVTWNNQIIGYNVYITGNAEAQINYDEDKTHISPAKMELSR